MKLKLKPTWILLGIGLLLLFLFLRSSREGFEDYKNAKCADGSNKVNLFDLTCLDKSGEPKCPSGEQVMNIFTLDGFQSKCVPSASIYDPKPGTDERNPCENDLMAVAKGGRKCVKALNSGVCPSGYELFQGKCVSRQPEKLCGDDEMESESVTVSGGVTTRKFVCLNFSTGKETEKQCPAGTEYIGQRCHKVTQPGSSAPSSPSPPAQTPSSSASTSSSTTQPTTSQFSQRIWGPPFVGTGQVGSGDGDSTKNTAYPQLLGGNASQYKGGDGSKIQFPSLGSLGLNADANFFPFSRSPGDMDLIADPFRVSQTFSAASYSPTPAPAPFLSDFSKFQ